MTVQRALKANAKAYPVLKHTAQANLEELKVKNSFNQKHVRDCLFVLRLYNAALVLDGTSGVEIINNIN